MERNFDNQLYAQQRVLKAQKHYEKQKTKRNITVWFVVSVIVFLFNKDMSSLLSILSSIGFSLLLGLIVCFAGFFIIIFINTQIFNIDEDKTELLRVEKMYVEKHGYDNFYYDHIYKGE